MTDTARDRAIAAMHVPYCTIELAPEGGWIATAKSCAAMLDAIPDRVLLDVLIERGALTLTQAVGAPDSVYRLTPHPGEST
jgi:hypothetical protein